MSKQTIKMVIEEKKVWVIHLLVDEGTDPVDAFYSMGLHEFLEDLDPHDSVFEVTSAKPVDLSPAEILTLTRQCRLIDPVDKEDM